MWAPPYLREELWELCCSPRHHVLCGNTSSPSMFTLPLEPGSASSPSPGCGRHTYVCAPAARLHPSL